MANREGSSDKSNTGGVKPSPTRAEQLYPGSTQVTPTQEMWGAGASTQMSTAPLAKSIPLVDTAKLLETGQNIVNNTQITPTKQDSNAVGDLTVTGTATGQTVNPVASLGTAGFTSGTSKAPDPVKTITGTASQAKAPDPVKTITGTASQAKAPDRVTATEYQAGQVDPNAVTVNGVTTDFKPNPEAAQALVDKDAMVQNQMSELLKGMESGNLPAWAEPAVAKVDAMLAARGLSRSSIGQADLTNAIIQAAMPMAQQNAQTVQQTHMANLGNQQQANMLKSQLETQVTLANLSNEQQATLQNAQMKHATLLSNQSADNAAKQFNASNKTQVDTFMANLKSQVEMSNAAQATAMSQFNVSQANAAAQFNANLKTQVEMSNAAQAATMSQFNASQENAGAQFNANLKTQNEQFNVQTALDAGKFNSAQMNAMAQFNTQIATDVEKFNANNKQQADMFNIQNQQVIAQSNIDWRRKVATANTEMEHQANMQNAQNKFGLSNNQLSNMWQTSRDYASWAWQSGENDESRKVQMILASQNNQAAAKAAELNADATKNAGWAAAIGAITAAGVGAYFST